MFYKYFLFFIFIVSLGQASYDALKGYTGSWKLVESNYYLDNKLLGHTGDMNVSFTLVVEKNIMKWISNKGITKTFYFDFETADKIINTNEYKDTVQSSLIENKLQHSVLRLYKNSKKTMNVRNTFFLSDKGKTMHHIFEDLNGKKIYKVYSIYGRDPKSIPANK